MLRPFEQRSNERIVAIDMALRDGGAARFGPQGSALVTVSAAAVGNDSQPKTPSPVRRPQPTKSFAH